MVKGCGGGGGCIVVGDVMAVGMGFRVQPVPTAGVLSTFRFAQS